MDTMTGNISPVRSTSGNVAVGTIRDYETLGNKPKINSVELIGNKSLEDLGIYMTNPTSTTPIMDGTANVGSETTYARGDHVHPSDTTKVDKVSGKELSTNDYTNSEKSKLSNIASGAEVNQNAFSNIVVGSSTISSASKTDTFELEAGTNIILTPDTTNKKVTVSSTGGSSSDFMFGTCSTGASVVAKEVTITNSGFALIKGIRIRIEFENNNTADSPTLNVNSTGDIAIKYDGSATPKSLVKGIVEFIYDGTYWQLQTPNTPNMTAIGYLGQSGDVQKQGIQLRIFGEILNIPLVTSDDSAPLGQIRPITLASTTARGFMSKEDKAKLNKITLDANDKIDASCLPSYTDDIIEVYPVSGATELSAGWLSDSSGGTAITPETGKIYVLVEASNSYVVNSQFRWTGSAYVDLLSNKSWDFSRKGTQISANSDLNDYTTPGNYYVADASVATTIINTPNTFAGYELKVFVGYNGYCTQLAIGRNSTGDDRHFPIYIRAKYYLSADDTLYWSDWTQVAMESPTVPIGTYKSTSMGTGDASIASATLFDCASLSLEKGVWVVFGQVCYKQGGTAGTYRCAYLGTSGNNSAHGASEIASASNGSSIPTITSVISLNATTTIYLKGQQGSGSSINVAQGSTVLRAVKIK